MFGCAVNLNDFISNKLKSPTVRAIRAMLIECRWYCNALRSISAGFSSLRRMIYCARVSEVYFVLGALRAPRARDGFTHRHAHSEIHTHTNNKQCKGIYSHIKILWNSIQQIWCREQGQEKGDKGHKKTLIKNTPPSTSKLKCKCFLLSFFCYHYLPHPLHPTCHPHPFALHPHRPPPLCLLHPFVSELVKQSARAANYVFKWKRLVNVALGRGKMIGRGWWNWNECWGVIRSLTHSGGGGCGGGGRGGGASGTSRAHPGRCHLPGDDWKAGWKRERVGVCFGRKGVGVR